MSNVHGHAVGQAIPAFDRSRTSELVAIAGLLNYWWTLFNLLIIDGLMFNNSTRHLSRSRLCSYGLVDISSTLAAAFIFQVSRVARFECYA